jgi:signal transduction histidine kinase
VSDPSQVEILPAASSLSAPAGRLMTTVAELRRAAANGQRIGGAICLTGQVLTAASPKGYFAFQDQTGGVLVKWLGAGRKMVPGQLVVLQGSGALEGNVLVLSGGAVVDNDGLHSRREMTGAAFLRAGMHSIHLSWFNRSGPLALDVYYQGPDIRRQKIPDAALVFPEIGAAGESVKWVPGLNYLCYVGDWQQVPAVAQLEPAELAACPNFKTRGAGRSDKIDLEFNGFLKIPRDGEYYFTTASDDGSRLFIDEQAPQIHWIGVQDLPAPLSIVSRQILAPDQNNRWAEVSGKVNFAYQQGEALILELSSDYGLIRVEIADSACGSPQLLLGCYVKASGFCQSGLLPSGQGIAAMLYTPGVKQLEVVEFLPTQWNRYALEPIGRAISRSVSPDSESIFHALGKPVYNPDKRLFDLTDDSGTIEMDPVQSLSTNLTEPMEFIGRLKRSDTNVVLQCAIGRKPATSAQQETNALPLLTTVVKVKQLTREQAQLGYPVKIRGVITLVRGSGTGFIIQDDTSAIDVWWERYSSTSLPRVGDEWEVEGKTFAEFSPNIRVGHAQRVGVGAMPEPLHPTWDQMLNGSLDTRYVEIQGVVVGTNDNRLTLFTGNGRVQVISTTPVIEQTAGLVNALVRIRGCLIPVRDESSHQVQIGQFRMGNVSVNVDEPAPADLFQVGLKHVPDLLLFDARAAALQRVRISGQFLHQQNRELFVADGTNSIRVIAREQINLNPGDLVDAVGFPKLSGRTPVLQEALVRRIGTAPLPQPVPVSARSLFTNGCDGRLVSVEARVIGTTGNMWEKILELQAGDRIFGAKLENQHGALQDLVPGSWVRLSGLYAEQDVRWISGKPDVSFELLLDSPADVKVLKLPPWWTLRKAFVFIGGMTFVILATLLWIFLLRRRVEERTEQLGKEIHHRELLQRQSELEKERSRIARDMHDQLGANVTQIGLLAELTKKNLATPGELIANADKISRTAFHIGQGLDEIVWAVNPKNDSLNKFCDYVAVQAQELFQLTNILCRVDLPPDLPDHALNAEVRHNLFLATKEALNNVVRHAQAREVWVRFKLADGGFQISVVDDGNGFALDKIHSRRNGLQNMQKRMEDIGGSFAVTSQPKLGTEVTLTIQLNPSGANGS